MHYEKIVLKNGLRIILAPMQQVKSITAMVFFNVGSRYEKKDNNGVSHFLEHMFFKGTKRRPLPQSISEEIDAIGGEMNAGTSKEYTLYYIKARSRHTNLCLDVLSDMLLNSKFDAKEIKKERGVIQEEYRMYEDNPMRQIGDVFEKTMYGDQPLGWSTLGTPDTIESMDRKKLIDYQKKHYCLKNMVVGLSGDLETSHIIPLVEQYFSKFKPGKSNKYDPWKDKQQKPQHLVVERPTEQAHVAIGVKAFDRNDERRYPARVMNVILGGSMSSRLFVSLREESGLCYYVHSSLSSYHDAGSLTIQAGVDLTRTSQALAQIMTEMASFVEKPVGQVELSRAKEYIKGKMALAIEDPASVMEWVGMQQLLRGRIETLEEMYEKIDAVTAKDIQDVAQTIFKNQSLSGVLIGPNKAIDQKDFSKIVQFK